LLVGIIAGFCCGALAQGAPWASHLWGTAQAFVTKQTLAPLALISQAVRALACWGILLVGILSLKRFGGPYCGGSDLMTLQLSLAMAIAESTTSPAWRLGAAGYLCIQLCLSYWQSGWVKLVNPQWRNGRALWEVFAFTHYPVTQATRRWAEHPRILWLMGWLIMLVEFCFPLSLYYMASLYAGLVFMGLFHLANAWLFGLNRFFWIWLATYPTVIAFAPIIAEFMRR
ncbi:MAG TPA: hypothetical protein PKD17_18985, partial [Cellvibrionaceae bacterium]|nr:hypothetical protein [Cellvibrionaceae bacterium]